MHPQLPFDILLDVLLLLPINTVLVLRCTSKSLDAVTRLRKLWVLLFRIHVLDKHIPCPAVDIADLSANDLESLTRRALALRRTWTSSQPVPRRQLTFGAPTEHTARIISLHFLPGRSNRWLISVQMTARPRFYLLQCWDLAPDHPRCVAELRHADGPFGGVVVNSDPTSPAVFAMQSALTETFSIDFDAQDPDCGFVTDASIDGIRELHLLSGSTLVTRNLDDGGALSIWDLADLPKEELHLLNPSLVQPDDRIQAVHVAHDYALLVRIQSIEIYSTVPHPSLLAAHGVPIAYPLAQFKFPWRTDAVVLSPQHAPSASPLAPPIHLLVRFGSIYPWPVNLLHYYHLLPNPNYRPGRGGKRTPTPPSSPHAPSPSPSSSSSSHTHALPITTEYNLPYNPRPRPTHAISAPVRLFGQSAMALGRYGTALWLDNHSDAWLGPSERGQRLAGRIMSGWDRGDGVSNENANLDQDGGAGGHRMEATDADLAAATSSRDASMVFGVQQDDVWTRIAMEEETGRIALGHTDGAITLLEY